LSIFFLTCTTTQTAAYYSVYLQGYPGNLMLIELSDVTATTVSPLDLSNAANITPSSLAGKCGNPDVSPDGRTIVFGAINTATDSWDIYMGDLNLQSGSIDNLANIVETSLREEDPRFNYDGTAFVYKAGASWTNPVYYDINLYDIASDTISTLIECQPFCDEQCPNSCNHCELWGPVFHPCGAKVAFTARVCNSAVSDDEIYIYDMASDATTRITDNSLPDMYSHFLRDGNLLYSHNDGSRDDLCLYNGTSGVAVKYLDQTVSDDDPYAFKDDENLFLFIGLDDSVEGYELFLARRNGDELETFALTAETHVLGPVVFDPDTAATVPDFCDSINKSDGTASHSCVFFFCFVCFIMYY